VGRQGPGPIGEAHSQYTGREPDATGFYYYRARYYHPRLPRFVSEDPLGLDGGLNIFAFAANSTLRYVDFLGLAAEVCSRFLTSGGSPVPFRYAYVVTDDTDRRRPTLSLFVIDLVGQANFDAVHLGNAVSAFELSVLPKRPSAIQCQELPRKHRHFLRKLTFDSRGLPLHDGQFAGIDGCYKLRPR
jgi:RHS repeat-associated protein